MNKRNPKGGDYNTIVYEIYSIKEIVGNYSIIRRWQNHHSSLVVNYRLDIILP